MARYAVCTTGVTNAANTSNMLIQQESGTTRRLKVYDIILSSNSAPNDYSAAWEFQRFTSTPVGDTFGGTAITPEPLDGDDGAAAFTAVEDPSAEPSGGLNVLLTLAVNQRATFRWVAAPGSELVVPATADNGLRQFCTVINTATDTLTTMLVEE